MSVSGKGAEGGEKSQDDILSHVEAGKYNF